MSKADGKFDVAGVLAEHGELIVGRGRTVRPGVQENVRRCTCREDMPWAIEDALVAHRHHLAAAISAHIAETLGSSEAREALAQCLVGKVLVERIRPQWSFVLTDKEAVQSADAALAAVGDLLGVEVGR